MLDLRNEDGVLNITFNRPEVRNAFDDEMISAITQALTSVPGDVRAIVFRGAGKAFSAGGDLNWMRRMANYTPEENVADAERVAAMFAAIERAPVPTVAIVHGACYGGGCGIVSAVDFAFGTPEAVFAFSEVKLGLIPATISPFVIRKIGPANARSLFITGAQFSAEEALRYGLLTKVVAADAIESETKSLMENLVANPNGAMIEARNLVLDAPLSPGETARRLADARATADAQDRLAAFFAQRDAAAKR